MTDLLTATNAPQRLKAFVHEVHQTYPVISGKLIGYVDKLAGLGDPYFIHAGEILETVWGIAEKRGWSDEDIYDFYAEFVIDYLREQEKFQRTGAFEGTVKGFEEIRAEFYDDDEYMTQYMMGLMLSYAVFPHHYEQYRFYREQFIPSVPEDGIACEFGVGHGLFQALLLKGTERQCAGYDVSDAALELAHCTLEVMGVDKARAPLSKEDVVRHDLPDPVYDAFTAAGLLEHIEDPQGFLARIRKRLRPGTGRIFVMLPINTAHTDHIILFDSIDDCRQLMEGQGYQMVDERVVPTEDLPEAELAAQRTPIVYLGIYKVADGAS